MPVDIGEGSDLGEDVNPLNQLDLSEDTFNQSPPDKMTTIHRYLPNGELIELLVAYAVVGGKALYQGDILLGDAAAIDARNAKRKNKSTTRSVIRVGKKWPKGVLPYAADDGLAARVGDVAAYFKKFTNVTLKAWVPADVDYVRFVIGDENSSSIGRQGGEQKITLTPNSTLGTTIHEVCHALGLWHEQSRNDRDAYVEIVTENIFPGLLPQFAVQEADALCIGPYDYGSIMHYSADAFGHPKGSVTIRARNGNSIGQRNGLSAGDVDGLKHRYP